MKIKFGDIYTNGVNHWMVTLAGDVGCPRCGNGSEFKVELLPVILENGEPRHLMFGIPIKGIETIKPFAKKVGSLSKLQAISHTERG